MTHIKLTILSLILSFGILFGQNYTCDILPVHKSKSNHTILRGIGSDGFIYTSGSNNYLKVYDSETGKIISEKKVNDLSKLSELGYSYVGFNVIDGQPLIKCKKIGKSEDQSTYYVNLNHKLELVSEPYVVSESVECEKLIGSEFIGHHYHFIDDDSGMTMHLTEVTCKSDKVSKFKGILRDNKNNLINEFSFSLDYHYISSLDMTIYDKDTYFFSLKGYNEEKLEGKLMSRTEVSGLFQLDGNGNITEVDINVLDEGQLAGDLRVVKSDGKLLLNSQIIQEDNYNFKGVFSGIINPESNEVLEINKRFFNKEFVEKYWSDNYKSEQEPGGEEGFKDYFKMVDYFPTKDGGSMYFFQEYYMTTDNSGSRPVNYHTYQDLIAIKLNSESNIEWVHLILQNQRTPRYDPGTSIAAVEKDGEIIILYKANDYMCEMIKEGKYIEYTKRKGGKLENTYIAKINNMGEIETEVIADLKEHGDIFIKPYQLGIDKKNNRFIFVNRVSKKKSQLVYINY